MKHNQGAILYQISSIGNLDNKVDFEDETPRTFDSMNDALDTAKDIAKEDGLRTYVYKCIPIFRVDRGKIRVTKLKEGEK